MEREVKREKTLPSFAITLDELEILYNRLVGLFDRPESIYSSITIEFPQEQLKFKNIEELKQYSNFRRRVTKFSLYLSEDSKRVSISNTSRIMESGTRATVYATANNEAWCAGAVETVYVFMQMHKVWFHWLAVAPIWIGTIAFGFITMALQIFLSIKIGYHISVMSWEIIIFSLFILSFIQPRIFPTSTLVFIEEDSFIKRNIAQLTLLATVIGLIITALQLYLSK